LIRQILFLRFFWQTQSAICIVWVNDMPNKHAVILGRRGGRVGGKSKSIAKIRAARRNGKLGGRPKKNVLERTQTSSTTAQS
jgi:hypothetical protein